jgi:transposase
MGWTAPDGIDVPACGLLRATQEEPSAMSLTRIGLDTAKTVFHVHGVNEEGRAEIRRALRRRDVVAFFTSPPACTGGGLTGLGHEVRLIAPEAVRRFVERGRKNDAAAGVPGRPQAGRGGLTRRRGARPHAARRGSACR